MLNWLFKGISNLLSPKSERGLAAASQKTRERVAHEGGVAVSRDREHMAKIGRKGGKAPH